MKAVVLYEDQYGQTGNFGLHIFVLACVADRIGVDRWSLRHDIEGIPKKGDNKLLRACREDAGKFPCPVIALFDNDQIRPLVKLPADARKRDVAGKIKADCLAPSSLFVILLVQNTEDVLRAVHKDHGDVSDDQLEAALQKKDPNARDAILHKAAAAPPALRSSVLEAVPSLGCVVARLAEVME